MREQFLMDWRSVAVPLVAPFAVFGAWAADAQTRVGTAELTPLSSTCLAELRAAAERRLSTGAVQPNVDLPMLPEAEAQQASARAVHLLALRRRESLIAPPAYASLVRIPPVAAADGLIVPEAPSAADCPWHEVYAAVIQGGFAPNQVAYHGPLKEPGETR